MNSSRFVFMVVTLLVERCLIIRGDDVGARSLYFLRKAEDVVFRNHVIAEHLVASEIECGYRCMHESNCVSFNYEDHSESLPHVCEISDDREQNDPASVIVMEGFNYFELQPNLLPTGAVSCHKKVESCLSLKEAGQNKDGLYHISLPNVGSVQVFCDQSTDGGGWTLVQRRTSPFSLSFNRNWVEYENGFGNLKGEFWLGNKIIHELAKTNREVKIVLKASNNLTGDARYSYFKVHGPNDKYRLEISDYRGNIGDCGSSFSMQYFTTNDSDDDARYEKMCADDENAGWWYGADCGCGNLNRQSRPKWYSWIIAKDQIVYSEMKIR